MKSPRYDGSGCTVAKYTYYQRRGDCKDRLRNLKSKEPLAVESPRVEFGTAQDFLHGLEIMHGVLQSAAVTTNAQ
jgi:hypothetical protein